MITNDLLKYAFAWTNFHTSLYISDSVRRSRRKYHTQGWRVFWEENEKKPILESPRLSTPLMRCSQLLMSQINIYSPELTEPTKACLKNMLEWSRTEHLFSHMRIYAGDSGGVGTFTSMQRSTRFPLIQPVSDSCFAFKRGTWER